MRAVPDPVVHQEHAVERLGLVKDRLDGLRRQMPVPVGRDDAGGHQHSARDRARKPFMKYALAVVDWFRSEPCTTVFDHVSTSPARARSWTPRRPPRMNTRRSPEFTNGTRWEPGMNSTAPFSSVQSSTRMAVCRYRFPTPGRNRSSVCQANVSLSPGRWK